MDIELEFVPDLGQDLLEFAKHTQMYDALTAIRNEITDGGMSRSAAVGLESVYPGILEGHNPNSFTEIGSKTKLTVAVEAIDWKRGMLVGGAVLIILTVLFKFLSWLHEAIFGRKSGKSESYEALKEEGVKLRKETEKRLADLQERHKPLFTNPDANRVMDAALVNNNDHRIVAASYAVATLLEEGKIPSHYEAERRMASVQACIMRTRYDTMEQMELQALIFTRIAHNPVNNYIPGGLRIYPGLERNSKIALGDEMFQSYHILMSALEKIAPSFEGIVKAAERRDMDQLRMFVFGTKAIGQELTQAVRKFPHLFKEDVSQFSMNIKTRGFRRYGAIGTEDYKNWTTFVDKACYAKHTITTLEQTRGWPHLDLALDLIYAITDRPTYRNMSAFYEQVDRGMKDATQAALKDHRGILDSLEKTIKTLEHDRKHLLGNKDSALKVKLSPELGYIPAPGTKDLKFTAPDSGEDALEFLMSLAKTAMDLIRPINRAGIGYCLAWEKALQMMKK